MPRCIIITPLYQGEELAWITPGKDDLLICADGGCSAAAAYGLEPHLIIGDFDSLGSVPAGDNVIRLPVHKDDTDTVVCLREGRSRGYREFIIAGGLGGRFDHTMGNLGILAKYCEELPYLALIDGQNYVRMIYPGYYELEKNPFKYLGVISYGDFAEMVTLRGVKYPLEEHFLTHATSLGVSNEITADVAEISFTSGKLLIILSKDIDK